MSMQSKIFLSLIYEEAFSTCDVLANVCNSTAFSNYTGRLESAHN